jgi:hypothetical protein
MLLNEFLKKHRMVQLNSIVAKETTAAQQQTEISRPQSEPEKAGRTNPEN